MTLTDKEKREIDAQAHEYGAFFTSTRLYDNYVQMYYMHEYLPLLINSLSLDLLDYFMFYILLFCYNDDIEIKKEEKTIVYWG